MNPDSFRQKKIMYHLQETIISNNNLISIFYYKIDHYNINISNHQKIW